MELKKEKQEKARALLVRLNCSLVVISREGAVRTFYNRGVRDLYTLLRRDPEFMDGAVVADKLTGAGAAVLMSAGNIDSLFTFVVSEPALERLRNAGIEVEYENVVSNIINRAGTDICPVEKLVAGVPDIKECVDKIGTFLSGLKQ